MSEDNNIRFVTIQKYAELCSVGAHAIYARLKKSDDGIYSEGHQSYLELTILEGVDPDAVFIDIKRFPPHNPKKGRPFKNIENAK